MSLSNNKITAPVSVDDVADCLGMTRSSTLADLCTSSKINVWAKYRPTVFPSPFPDDWYKAKDGNYGINITVENGKSNWKDLVAEYSKANNGYTTLYNKPTGGASVPFRLGDFRGYFHNANPEVKDYLSTSVFIRESDTNQILTLFNPVSADGLQVSYFLLHSRISTSATSSPIRASPPSCSSPLHPAWAHSPCRCPRTPFR